MGQPCSRSRCPCLNASALMFCFFMVWPLNQRRGIAPGVYGACCHSRAVITKLHSLTSKRTRARCHSSTYAHDRALHSAFSISTSCDVPTGHNRGLSIVRGRRSWVHANDLGHGAVYGRRLKRDWHCLRGMNDRVLAGSGDLTPGATFSKAVGYGNRSMRATCSVVASSQSSIDCQTPGGPAVHRFAFSAARAARRFTHWPNGRFGSGARAT